jgi:TfoX/Sxy family transcriptional regulator of competence genes
MATYEKSPIALVERFTSIVDTLPGVERRQMFGNQCIFVGGNLVSGLFEDQWFVRLPPDGTAELAGLGGVPFSPMPGRPMRAYTMMPEAVMADEAQIRRWVERSIELGRTLPPKASSTAKRPTKG